jgi:hypothetical protein
MTDTIREHSWEDLYSDGVCQPSSVIKSVLNEQMIGLPGNAVSDHETRYPIDEPSMRAFLDTFFTRHMFQLQRSLVEYIATLDFRKAVQCGPLRILDIDAGPAVASLGIIDLVHRMAGGRDPRTWICPRGVRIVHVLNDTSPICLTTGRRMLAACCQSWRDAGLVLPANRVFALPTAFPNNIPQIQRLASFLGGYDIIILSYVLSPLTDDYSLRTLASAITTLEGLCRSHGRILVVQDRFQDSLVRSLAQRLDVEYREQTVTQEIYPPRGANETYTYTYYDCLYAPRERAINHMRHVA